MTAEVIPLERASGVGRQPAAVEALRDARDEITALMAEARAFASEVRAVCRRLELAVIAERPDLALHMTAQLYLLAERQERRGGDEAA